MSDAEKLLKAIAGYAKTHPELRLGQILHNIGLDVKSPNYQDMGMNKDLFYLSDEVASKMWVNFIESHIQMDEKKRQSQLCYVESSIDYDEEGGYFEFDEDSFDLYFTTQDLQDQWGNDWNDAPYEHNGGRPCYPREDDEYQIFRLRLGINGAILPKENYSNSPYSVQDINLIKEIPWIRAYLVNIFAGTTYKDTLEIAKTNKWVIYYE